jgi:hypothetical protein
VNLTRGQWVTSGVTLGAVILSVFFHISIREWYQPDVRYEEGSWYRSSGVAVGSLKLHNIGHSDAEEIQITTFFPEPLTDVATSAHGTPFKVIAGGLGDTKVTGVISRLVRDEAVYLYFAMNNHPDLNVPSHFVSSIKFKGGQGKTGYSTFFALLLLCLGAIVGVATGLLTTRLADKVLLKPRLASYYQNLAKSIQIGFISAKGMLSEYELRHKMEEEFKNVSFRKLTIIHAGISAYRATKSGKSGSNQQVT